MVSTGNKFLDQINRANDRSRASKSASDKKAEHDKKAAVARARAGTKTRAGGGRSALRKSAGRASGRGRGISAKANKNGKGFAGILKYALDPKKGMQIVCTNCPSNPLPTMIRSAEMRPDILKSVGHITLSLPPSTGRLSADRWSALADELRLQIGLDDTFPFLVVQHQDTEHDHVHIIFSRLSMEGRVHDQSNIGLRLMAAEQVLEDKFSLPLVPRGQKANLTKGEIEQSLRTGKAPARVEIARALDEALCGSPTLNQLIERLAMAGISTKVNEASSGKISGLSFELGGVAFRASKIGKRYGWKALSERLSGEVKNEQARSNQQAAKPNEGARGGSKDPSGANARTYQTQPTTARLAGQDQQAAASVELVGGRAVAGGRHAGGDGRLSTNQGRSTSNKSAVQTNQKGDSKMTVTTQQDYMTAELAGRDPMLMDSSEILDICLSSSTSPRVQNYFSGVADGKFDGVGNKDDDDYLAGLNFARVARRAGGMDIPFIESRRLDEGMREWVEGIPNRIRGAGGRALAPRGERLALMDSRGRVAAVFHRGEILIPDPRILQPEQIAALMAALDEGGQQIEVDGNPALLDKIEAEAVSRGLMNELNERIVQEQIALDDAQDAPAMKM